MTFEGIIIKGYSGFYYVWDGQGLWECSLRGKYRTKKQNFLPGDKVVVSTVDLDKKKAVIESVEPRKTELYRPIVANVEQVIIVLALSEPKTDFILLDRLLIMAQTQGVRPIVCFNKADLTPPEYNISIAEKYERAGFPVIVTSSIEGLGIAKLKEALKEKVSVFAGPSGVGKSSLLNALESGLSLKTQGVSGKLLRGKHTTRHVELIRLSCGGLLADTPGFSRLVLPPTLKQQDLTAFYPDFLKFSSQCRFNSCLHKSEPACAVREAAQGGEIDFERYERYLQILSEVAENERRY